jgi:hypothetical protein
LERMGLVPEQATIKPLPWAPVSNHWQWSEFSFSLYFNSWQF